MNNLNAGWSRIWDERKREEWGNKGGGGNKWGVKVPAYTAGGARFQHTLQQGPLQFQSTTKVEKAGNRLSCLGWRVDSQMVRKA